MYLTLVIPLLIIGGIIGLMLWAALRDSKRETPKPNVRGRPIKIDEYQVEVEKDREALR